MRTSVSRYALANQRATSNVFHHPNAEFQLTAEHALRAAIDTQIFATLRSLEALDGGRAVQQVYVALLRRLPNVTPDRRRIAIDCGFSESSVKRAIKLLERTGLASVERTKGKSSVYTLADIRRVEVASECLSRIRKLSTQPEPGTVIGRDKSRPIELGSRVTSEPSGSETRVRCEPSSRAASETGVGSLLAHKETNKNQNKQQCAVAELIKLKQALETWGLTSAAYLFDPNHEKSIAVLCEGPGFAAAVIERAMRKGNWSKDSGVGAKVQYLRRSVEIVATQIRAELNCATKSPGRARKRASEICSTLPSGALERDEIGDVLYKELLERGLKRLSESDEVISDLRSDELACKKIVVDELGRERYDKAVREMSDETFAATCESLFSIRPGLRGVYPQPQKSCNGLRLFLIDAMRSGEVVSGVLTSEEDSSVPRERPLETRG